MYIPVNPQFYYIKVGLREGQNYIGMFSWWMGTQQMTAYIYGGTRKQIIL